MNTLEIRPHHPLLWLNKTPEYVRDRRYSGAGLSKLLDMPISLDSQTVFCQAWIVDGFGTMLVEIPERSDAI